MGVVLITAWASLASAEPPSTPPDDASHLGRSSVCDRLTQGLSGYKVPGRKPDSEMPWEFFLGNASHQLIAYIYRDRNPMDRVYTNKYTLKTILQQEGLGNGSLLTAEEQLLRPDITNIDTKELFEIKPLNPEGLQVGIQKAQTYLLAINQTLSLTDHFHAGKRFEGEVLVQFAQGQYIWHLEWCTSTPGVTQYRWTRTQQRFDSSAAAYSAGQWTDLSEQELKRYGGQVAQAVEGMVDRRERLATISGTVGAAIDLIGEVAVIILSTVTPDEPNSAQSMGKVLPFPSRSQGSETISHLPKASGL